MLTTLLLAVAISPEWSLFAAREQADIDAVKGLVRPVDMVVLPTPTRGVPYVVIVRAVGKQAPEFSLPFAFRSFARIIDAADEFERHARTTRGIVSTWDGTIIVYWLDKP